VLLPGDPGRALQLATELLDKPIMFNHARGLWGYTGAAADGEPLTIQSTGIGGVSAAIVVEELCTLGIETAIRIGTAWSGPRGPGLGALVAVRAARAQDGASRAHGAPDVVHPDAELAAALAKGRPAEDVLSRDVVARVDELPGSVVADLSTAAVLHVAATHNVRAAAILAVAHDDALDLDEEALKTAASRLGAATARALGIRA
jgi:uridine phosphorylase